MSHYLDNAATTAVLPQAAQAAMEAMTGVFGNPSSLHEIGREARAMLESSRAVIAAALGCVAYYILYFFKSFAYDGLLMGGLTAATAAAALPLKIPASIFNGAVAIILAPPLCIALRHALKRAHLRLP